MEWISFFGPRRPINGQKIFYYGEPIGVWSGTYKIDRNDPYCEHLIICDEKPCKETSDVLAQYGLDNLTMMVDRMDAPWWMPNEGQTKPPKPNQPYPDDYPK
jgi:hypothetical protein